MDYTEEIVKPLTLHVYAAAIACGTISVEEARERTIKALDWLAAAGRLLPAAARPAAAEIRSEVGRFRGEHKTGCECPACCWDRGAEAALRAVGMWVEPAAEPKVWPECHHCGKPASGGITFIGSSAFCSTPCFALVTEDGHPATALRRGPCPDCAELAGTTLPASMLRQSDFDTQPEPDAGLSQKGPEVSL